MSLPQAATKCLCALPRTCLEAKVQAVICSCFDCFRGTVVLVDCRRLSRLNDSGWDTA